MDALDILTDLENVIPFFQPIFSADEHRVIGYEVLGRYISENQLTSLGSFFQDDQIPEEYKFEVDQLLLVKALEKALESNEDFYIFLNRTADLLMYNHGEPFLNELLAFEKRGLNLQRIVLEISEQNYQGDINQLDHLLQYYRTYGIKIAIARIDSDSNYFDRIGQLEPDILKINLQVLKSTTTGTAFNDILFSLSLLARKIGATLLFENIEMEYQLHFAWKNGGRYYQGYYLSKPASEFIEHDLLKDRLKEKFHDFILYGKKRLESFYSTSDFFQVKVQEIILKSKKTSYEELFELLMKEMDQIAFRMYVCDEDGFQQSPNFFKGKDGWGIQKEYINKNWSWRPYFLENIFKMRNEKKGILSDLYSDIETGETTRTFSFPMNPTEFLFIDIAYNYLFEHDDLL
ncbi:EAL-associated domain-containing protein [Neobacillus sp. PS3-40]|jgi:EAL domain-containing protein (putative c-di-GMP-specific phosphodiesterase class I)|uniref:EAL domain-containing protein n=1 Tax=Neobacillus sp. PS3-40 TaxID=3070679 RepID=UPI0027E14883|nr:EAL-associated domain-containing protein [Neobacillus sp. PS3-40]WML43532.1 EAL-associated domain-containing protein [Neobacillus sp. PS3-40]